MTYDEFCDKYRRVKNMYDTHACFDGCLFETYGIEIEHVKEVHKKHPNLVWTVIEGDDGELYLATGYHWVNRFGFFITEKPWSEDEINTEILID